MDSPISSQPIKKSPITTMHLSSCKLLPHIVLLLIACRMILPATAGANDLPQRSVVLPGISEDSMRVRLDESDLQPIEGIWHYPNEQITLAIEKWHDVKNIAYRLVLLESQDLDLLPGTVMGYIAPSAIDNKFKLWLYSERDHSLLSTPLECVATLNATATSLTFDPPHWEVKTRVNIARFLPSIFGRFSITPEKKQAKLPMGFNKIYPMGGNGNAFNEIRYL